MIRFFAKPREDHVFIVGLPRSGTSIVYRSIQRLPSFTGFWKKPLNLWETRIFREDGLSEGNLTSNPSLLGYLNDQRDVYGAFLSAVGDDIEQMNLRGKDESFKIEFEAFDGVAVRPVFTADNTKVELRWRESANRRVIQRYFEFARRVRRSRRVVEKTPHHYQNVHQILWTFPEARIIWMLRHPVRIFVSSLARSKKDLSYTHYWDVDGFISEFKSAFHRLEVYRKAFPGRIHTIQYEEFVKNPDEQLAYLCSLIDERYDPKALTIRRRQWPSGNCPDPLLLGTISNRLEEGWIEHISKTEVERIESGLNLLMEEMGYKSVLSNDTNAD